MNPTIAKHKIVLALTTLRASLNLSSSVWLTIAHGEKTLDDGKAKTLEEIGRRFSVTRERIRQIEARALHKLRQPYRNHAVKCYVSEYS